MGREAWRATVHGVAKSWTGLSNWTELNTGIKLQMNPNLWRTLKHTHIGTQSDSTRALHHRIKKKMAPFVITADFKFPDLWIYC